MVQRTFYMDGAIDKKTLTEAREVAKREAKKLEKNKTYGHTRDGFVYIDKYNNVTHKSVSLEGWKWTGTRFVKYGGK